MGLTIHQRNTANKALASLRVNNYTLLSGLAGTGKTFTTNEIVAELKREYKSVSVTSTTNQACSVLSKEMKNTGIEVLTINKFLAMRPVHESQELVLRTTDYNKIQIVDYLIIDEFSMLTQVVVDTLEHYRLNYNPSLKILLVGDATQLILEPDTINKLNLDESSFFLEEPMRANKDSSIAKYGLGASAAIRAKVKAPEILFDDISDMVKYKDHAEFINAWKKATEEKSPEDIKILCFTNAKVKSYNKNIKELYYKQEEEYAKGNVIVLRNPVSLQPNSGLFSDMLPNNSKVMINRVVPLTMNCTDGSTEHGYTIYPDGYSGKYFYIPKSKAALNRYLQPMVDKKDWKNFYLNKDKFAIAHHAEAGTVHSSQGSSFEEVFIDASDIMTAREFINRLAYVAITRASKKVHIFLGDTRDFSAFNGKYVPTKTKVKYNSSWHKWTAEAEEFLKMEAKSVETFNELCEKFEAMGATFTRKAIMSKLHKFKFGVKNGIIIWERIIDNGKAYPDNEIRIFVRSPKSRYLEYSETSFKESNLMSVMKHMQLFKKGVKSGKIKVRGKRITYNDRGFKFHEGEIVFNHSKEAYAAEASQMNRIQE